MNEFGKPVTQAEKIEIAINFLNDLRSDMERMNAYQIHKIRYMLRKEQWNSSQAMHHMGFALEFIQYAIEALKDTMEKNQQNQEQKTDSKTERD